MLKEMNSIFDEEHIDAEVVLYEVIYEQIERCRRPKVDIQVLPVDKAHPFLEFDIAEQSPERKINLVRIFLGVIVSTERSRCSRSLRCRSRKMLQQQIQHGSGLLLQTSTEHRQLGSTFSFYTSSR